MFLINVRKSLLCWFQIKHHTSAVADGQNHTSTVADGKKRGWKIKMG